MPSLVSIVVTYIALRLTQREALRKETIESTAAKPYLGHGGRLAAGGIGAIGVVLIGASALDVQLGLPTFLCGVVTTASVLALSRQSPLPLLKQISWGVLPLVAGLFVMVEGLIRTGLIARLSKALHDASMQSPDMAAWAVGLATAVADNAANNLPVGLVAGSVVANDHLPGSVVGSILIGVDLGPNLSITGSLATILWLAALRREGIKVSALSFFGLGLLVTRPVAAGRSTGTSASPASYCIDRSARVRYISSMRASCCRPRAACKSIMLYLKPAITTS